MRLGSRDKRARESTLWPTRSIGLNRITGIGIGSRASATGVIVAGSTQHPTTAATSRSHSKADILSLGLPGWLYALSTWYLNACSAFEGRIFCRYQSIKDVLKEYLIGLGS